MKRVRIYSTRHCGYCSHAKALLRSKGIPYEEIDVTGDDEARRNLVETTGQRTVPQIFIGEEHVGGYTDLAKLDREGRLDKMLASGEQTGA